MDVEVGARAGQGLSQLAISRRDEARACLRTALLRATDRPAWWFQGRELLAALTVRLQLLDGEPAKAGRTFRESLALAERHDLYGAAWLVADVAGPLADAGVTSAWAEVERYASRLRELNFAPLTARYSALQNTV